MIVSPIPCSLGNFHTDPLSMHSPCTRHSALKQPHNAPSPPSAHAFHTTQLHSGAKAAPQPEVANKASQLQLLVAFPTLCTLFYALLRSKHTLCHAFVTLFNYQDSAHMSDTPSCCSIIHLSSNTPSNNLAREPICAKQS
jgi:hypothetical protein